MNEKPGKPGKNNRLKARLPRGLLDSGAAEIAATRRMIETIRAVYERYGFEPVETPAIEYTDALGKFLPDQDRPNEGVFSFQDDDEQWLSLRYDLTAPLARYVAENFDACKEIQAAVEPAAVGNGIDVPPNQEGIVGLAGQGCPLVACLIDLDFNREVSKLVAHEFARSNPNVCKRDTLCPVFVASESA